MSIPRFALALLLSLTAAACAGTPSDPLARHRAETTAGVVEGVAGAHGGSVFRGIPYAAPPVGDLRWKPPQPAASWTDVRKADRFGNRCVQTNPFPDMRFQSPAESEDCLTLSIWTPASASTERLPAMVWIHGGGFFSGAGDEFRHEGTKLASNGVVLVHFNYRLGVIGFLSHPALTAESEHHSSGNYGLLDQIAALRWVHDNIAAFGGDPGNVTIFGESAGSLSVSALMASPLTDGLFQKAIGESGAYVGGNTLPALPLAEAESRGVELGKELKAPTLAALRALPAADIVKAVGAVSTRFAPNVDGTAVTEHPSVVFAAGRQRHVPLLAGWNSAESKVPATTAAAFKRLVQSQYGRDAARVLERYPAGDDRQATLSATALASDNFIGFGTWKWIEVHAATGGAPVYRYLFDHLLPTETGGPAPDDPGAAHATEIEFVFGTLDSRRLLWRDADRRVSDVVASYWTGFAKTGNPSATVSPAWPAYSEAGGRKVMRLKAAPAVEAETNRARYELLDEIAQAKKTGAR